MHKRCFSLFIVNIIIFYCFDFSYIFTGCTIAHSVKWIAEEFCSFVITISSARCFTIRWYKIKQSFECWWHVSGVRFICIFLYFYFLTTKCVFVGAAFVGGRLAIELWMKLKCADYSVICIKSRKSSRQPSFLPPYSACINLRPFGEISSLLILSFLKNEYLDANFGLLT